MSKPISIDIWSDIACPWCYIGKRNLEKGIAEISGDEDAPRVTVTFHSYELSPDVPVDYAGTQIDYLIERKGMPRKQVEQMLDRVTGIAADAGLAYRMEQVQTTNTVKAHELIHYAKTKGLQDEMKERLLSAYFVEGKHVGRADDLVELAVEVGLDAVDVREALTSDRHLPDVRQDQAQARAYGIQGVPFFVIDGQYGISGAQPPEAFASLLRDLWSKRGEAEPAARS